MVREKACEAAKTSGAAVVPEHRAGAADTAHPAQANRHPGTGLNSTWVSWIASASGVRSGSSCPCR